MEENIQLQLEIGSPAPNFCLPSSAGNEVCLTDFQRECHIVLFFVREFAWMQCRALVAQLGRHDKDFQNACTQIIPVLGERVELAQEYASKLKLPFPVLADPERQVYHRYGLQKAIILIQRSAYFIIDKRGVVQSMKTTINPLVWLDEYDHIFQEVLRINRSYFS